MKKLLRALAVRTKLLSSFLLLASFVLVLGLTSIILQHFIKESNRNTTSSIILSDSFFEGKYFLRSDLHIFKELVDAENKEDFDYWWGEHVFQIQFFNDQLTKIEQEFDKNSQLNEDALRNKIYSITGDIRSDYSKNILPLFNQFSDLKNEEFQLLQKESVLLDSLNVANNEDRINYIQEQYGVINDNVTRVGLELITRLDKGKDMVRTVVVQMDEHAGSLLSTSSNVVTWVTIIGVLFSIIIAMYIAKLITKPVLKILNHVNQLGIGEQPKLLQIIMQDEFGDIQKSLNKLTTSLVETTRFSNEIGVGNFTSDFEPMGKNDVLGNSLLQMRDSLKKAKSEEEIRRLEDERQAWAANGTAKFSDIMRQTGESLDALSYRLIKELVDYCNANQGALFVANADNENDVFYQCTAAVAYGREKHLEQEIRVGEGLVGRVAYEAKTIYMKEIPNDYVKITSGLGESNPNVILLVPVKLKGKVNGVIELLSMKELEQYKVEFIEKVAENIASFIESIKVNERTATLLTESKHQSEELAAQEEEMRQNMEELQATQEEAARREQERGSLWDTVGNLTGILEIDLSGDVLSINEKASKILSIDIPQYIGKSFIDSFLMGQTFDGNSLWQSVRSGNQQQIKIDWNKSDEKLVVNMSLSKVINSDSEHEKVLCLISI